jgi:glycosyltransferase involved in cell wall biosynthesis
MSDTASDRASDTAAPGRAGRRILFAHKNFPAQFGAFGEWLAGQGWEVGFLTQREGAEHPAFRVVVCADHRQAAEATHRYVRGFEQAVITGQGFARAALGMRAAGFRPDVLMAHAGWGAGIFLKDVWPEAACIPYFEWYYNWPYVDRTPFDADPGDPLDALARTRVRNAALWADFSTADRALCPTRFQAAQFPDWLRPRLTVMHDGVDTDLHAPAPPGAPRRAILARWGVPEDAEVVTSITRGMEPHRGFPETMRALALLLARRPRLHALIGGEDRVAYGAQLPEGDSWKRRMLAELDLDLSRVHFTGLLSRQDMVALMRAGDAHVYLTVPFVLSWSLLDAMATGCLIVASDTPPVREFMTEGRTGLLVPPHDPAALAARIEEALDAGDGLARLRARARARIVEGFDATRVVYPRKRAWLEAAVRARG